MPDYSYNKDYPFAAFITNLGKYNEGELVGEWVKFPTTAEEMKEVFKRIGIGQRDDFGQPYPRFSPRSCGEKAAVFDTFPSAPIAKAGTRPSVYPLAASPLLFLLISRPRWACPLPPRPRSHPSPRR